MQRYKSCGPPLVTWSARTYPARLLFVRARAIYAGVARWLLPLQRRTLSTERALCAPAVVGHTKPPLFELIGQSLTRAPLARFCRPNWQARSSSRTSRSGSHVRESAPFSGHRLLVRYCAEVGST